MRFSCQRVSTGARVRASVQARGTAIVDHMPLLLVRVVLPVATAIAGVVLLVIGGDAAQGAGVVLIGVAGLVALGNALIRLGLQSERDREREEARRQFFSEHGHWPGEK